MSFAIPLPTLVVDSELRIGATFSGRYLRRFGREPANGQRDARVGKVGKSARVSANVAAIRIKNSMKRFLVGLLLLVLPLAFCAAASAKGTVAPPGNSSVSEYVESIPTVKGNRPTTTIGKHGGAAKHSGATVGASGSSSASGTSRASGAGSATTRTRALTSADQRALARQGSSGRQTAALVAATAIGRGGSGSGPGGGATGGSGSALNANGSAGSGGSAVGSASSANSPANGSAGSGNGGSAPASSVLSAMIGGGSQGGLGPVLLVILILVALAPGLLLLRKRRGADD